MGKTAGNAVWLDPNKTSPFDFYQYWRNVGDADVLKCIRMLTFLPLEQIDEMDAWEGSQLNKAKEILAYELTKMVHGEEEAKKAQEGAHALFGAGADTANMPTTQLADEDLHRRPNRRAGFAGENRPGQLQGRGPQAHPAGGPHRGGGKGHRHQQDLPQGRL